MLAAAGLALAPGNSLAAGDKDPSFFDSLGASFKRGADNVASFFKPKPKKVETPEDAISLSRPSRGGPDLHIAMAKLYEETNRKPEAIAEYDTALKMAPQDPKVLAACAQFKAREGAYDEAIKLFQRALRLTPNDPALLNDLALCHARRGQYPQAVSHLERAVQLQPASPLYRNNLAAVLVEMGQPDEALRHLRAVHPAAVAHYNLGYLLNKRGQSVAAAQQFAYALQRDPSLGAARYWLNRIGAQGGEGIASQESPGAVAGQTMLSQPPLTNPPPQVTALPPVNASNDAAPLPPTLATGPGQGYADPQMQPQTPLIGQSPTYPPEIRRQGFVVEVVDDPKPRAKRRPQADEDEPAPLPDDHVRRLPASISRQLD
jgi:tetratricopeptide (TPR) repeat protein